MKLITTFDITRNNNGAWSTGEDQVIREVPVTLYLNGEELVTLLATPQYLDELALGYLWAEGFLSGLAEVAGIEADPMGNWVRVTVKGSIERELKMYGRRMLTSGCGRGSVFYQSLDALDLTPLTSFSTVQPEAIRVLVRELQERSLLFRQTGGVHAAALATCKAILLFREDIGRHNAVDKIAGRCLLDGIATGDKLLLTSGRVSSEIVIKTAKLGVPILVSPSAPTDLAVQLARRLRLTLVGFARGRRFSVYSEARRLEG